MFHIFFSVCWALISSCREGEASGKLHALRRGLCDMNLLGHFPWETLKSEPMGAFFMIWPDLGAGRPSQLPSMGSSFTEPMAVLFSRGLPAVRSFRCPGCRVNACFRSCSYLSQVLRRTWLASARSSQESPLHSERPRLGTSRPRRGLRSGKGLLQCYSGSSLCVNHWNLFKVGL